MNETIDEAGIEREPIDLSNCDREPIHILGRVQSYGALLAISPRAS